MSVPIRSSCRSSWGCGDANDRCCDMAALAIKACWLIHVHVQTGAVIGRGGGQGAGGK